MADVIGGALGWFFRPEPVWYHRWEGGFALFGVEHLACLAGAAALVVALLLRYRRLGARRRLRQLRAMAGTAVGLVVSKDLVYVACGLFEPLFWPLHICNLCEFVALAYAVAPHGAFGRRMGDILFCWGITGGLGALLFPGWSYYTPAFCYASLCGFAEHALILSCALCPLSCGDFEPRPRRVWFVALVSAGLGLLFRLVNPLLGTNFFFVTDPASEGGPFPWLVETFGPEGFLVAYLVAAIATWGACYAVWALATRRGRAGH